MGRVPDSRGARDTLATGSGYPATVPRWPYGGMGTLADASLLGSTVNQGKYARSASWGDVVVTTTGGTYRLCWCSMPTGDANRRRRLYGSPSGDRCSSPEDFEVDFGHLFLVGPYTDHARTCVAGQTCFLGELSAGAGASIFHRGRYEFAQLILSPHRY